MGSGSGLLVLGGAGFIGSNFVRHVVDGYDPVYVVDKLTYAGDRRNLDGVLDDVHFLQHDIRDEDALADAYEAVDRVVNFAAESHVDRSIESGRRFVRSNVEGSFVAMDELRRHDVDRFVHLSTDEVYGSTTDGAHREDDRLDPSSPYAASKASADLMVNALRETYGLPITVVRPTNVYGPRQHPEKLIPKFTLRALRGDRLPIYGDGSNVRQWLYVDDICRALLAVLDRGDSKTYNVAGLDEKTNLEVTDAIVDHAGASPDLKEFVEDRRGHDYRYALDDSRFRQDVEFEPSVPFDDGIERTVDWYRTHRDRYAERD